MMWLGAALCDLRESAEVPVWGLGVTREFLAGHSAKIDFELVHQETSMQSGVLSPLLNLPFSLV